MIKIDKGPTETIGFLLFDVFGFGVGVGVGVGPEVILVAKVKIGRTVLPVDNGRQLKER